MEPDGLIDGKDKMRRLFRTSGQVGAQHAAPLQGFWRWAEKSAAMAWSTLY